MPRSQLHASTFHVGDRNSLNAVSGDAHIWDARDVFDQEPLGSACVDDPAGVLKHFTTIEHRRVLVVSSVGVRNREPLTRRARHNSVQPARHAGEITDVTTSDLVGRLNDAEPFHGKRTVQQTDSREQ
jgi:hypothetical protein